MNLVMILGNVGQDPVLTYSAGSGMAIAKFSVATSKKVKEEKKTQWHNMVAFGKTAEFVAKYVHKGDRFAFQGEIDYNTVEKDGQKRTYTSIIIDKVDFCGGNRAPDAVDSAQSAPANTQTTDDDLPF